MRFQSLDVRDVERCARLRQATVPLSHVDDWSGVVLKTHVHAHTCSTLLTSLVA